MKKIFCSAVVCISLFSYSLKAQWMQTNEPHNPVSSLIISGGNLFAGVNNSVYRSTDCGDHWTDLNSGFSAATFEVDGTNIFAGSINGFFLSTNNGITWERILDSLMVDPGDDFMPSYSIVIVGSNILAGGRYGGIFLSNDYGTTWTHVVIDTAALYDAGAFLVIQNASNNSRLEVFAVARNFGEFEPSLLYHSIDNGVSWTLSIDGLPINLGMGIGPLIALTNSNGNYNGTIVTQIYPPGECLNCKGSIYRSIDGGLKWELADTVIQNIRSFAVKASHSSDFDNYLFAGTFGNGVYLSTNNGADWVQINSGLADLNIETLLISENYLFAGTSSGVWRRPLSEIITAVYDDHINIVNHFELKQNYPNPFNPSTKIDFTISQSSFVSLKIYNVLGEEVAKLVNEIKAPGNYEVNFNAANLQSGIYFYKLQAGSLTESKKMILLK